MLHAPRAVAVAVLAGVVPLTSLFAAQEAEMRADYRPAFESFVRSQGAGYGLYLDEKAQAYLLRNDLKTGQPQHQPIAGAPLARLSEFVGKIPEGQVDARMAQAMRLYLDGREAKDASFEKSLFAKNGKTEVLTALGKSLLMDILTAEDGKLYKDDPESLWTRLKRKIGGSEAGAGPDGRVTPPAVRLPSLPPLDAQGLDHYYDGTGAPGGLSRFDWSNLGPKPTLTADATLEDYAIDQERGVVRVLVAAQHNVLSDRFAAPAAADARRIYREAGLDAKLFNAHGAKVVRAVDNLVTVEVPLPEAAKLGLALQKEGITSRPARVFRSAAAQIEAGRGWLAPTLQFLPLPDSFGTQAVNPNGPMGPMNADAANLLGLNGLWKKGMTGKDAIVGIIDSGADPNHPDLKGRIVEYVDMTGEGQKDGFGHGTHVAGSVGGSGAASGGLYKGAAPDTKFVIFKVFDKNGNTTEDTVLAAMKKAASMPADKRPQVINMSLGGPGDPDQDPIARMANHLVLKDNILVVAAAGNSGPTGGTVGVPGSAQYVLTVTGVNKQGEFPFFTSRGPIDPKSGEPYSKPDLSTVAGDVNLKAIKGDRIQLMAAGGAGGTGTLKTCVYGPGGVISDRSSDDPDTECMVAGHPEYRYMSGTSMAAPMAAGAAADVIGYLREQGAGYSATDVKAVLMETAGDLKKPGELQGAGLMNGERLASTVIARVAAGVPVGNIAYMLSVRLTTEQKQMMSKQTRFKATPLGIVDTQNGRLIKNDEELFWLMQEMKAPITVAYNKNDPPAVAKAG